MSEVVRGDAPLKVMLERGDFQTVFDESQEAIKKEYERTGDNETELARIVDLYAEKFGPELRAIFKEGAILGLVLLNEGSRGRRHG